MNTEEFLEQQKGNVIDAINETQNIEGLRDYFMPEPGAVASINGWYGGYPTICSINGAVLPVGMALYPHAPARLPLQPPHTTQIDQSARIAELEKDNNITHENLAWYMAKYHEHLTIIAELEKSEAFLKDAVDAAVKDIKHYRDEFLEMPEPEPVAYCYAWIDEDGDEVNRLGFTVPSEGFDAIPLHTTPPDQSARIAELEQQLAALQAKRDQLSDAEIQHIADKHLCAAAQFIGAGELWIDGTENFARAIEAAHGIGVNHE